jgi:hypothetical protein
MKTIFDAFDDPHRQALPPGADFTDWELTAAQYELAMLTAKDAARGTMPPAVASKIARRAAGFLSRPRGAAVRPATDTGWALLLGGSPLTVAAAIAAAMLGVVFAWQMWKGLSPEAPKGGAGQPCECGAAAAGPCR